MSCLAQLNQFLFTHARQLSSGDSQKPHPPGWPLYSYRCTDKAYEEFRQRVKDGLPQALKGEPPAGFEACFCLHAAETFRREHAGGAWTWKTVFDPLGVDVPTNPLVVTWVEKGLRHWQRPVLTGAAGQRLALATIACEGGLPLRLLHSEGTNLRTYFRKMLQAYHERSRHAQDLEALARNRIDALPQTLRNEEVVRLAAALIERTVKLQEVIGDAADPIAALDEQVADWRRTLPLRLDDDIAAALFKNLVEESRAIASAIAARPSWMGTLEELASGRFAVKKTLQFPSLMPKGDLAGLLGSEPKSRVRLLLNTRRRSEPVGVLSQFPDRDSGDAVYRREWLRRDGVVVTGVAVTEPHLVALHDGAQEVPIALDDEDAWGESPWVFVPTKDQGTWAWFSEGSVSTRVDQAVVVVPSGCNPVPAGEASCDHLGELPEVERRVFRITGRVDFVTPEGERYRVGCGAGVEMREAPQLMGKQLPHVLNTRPVYLGAPCFRESSLSRAPQVAEGNLQWRPVGSTGQWMKGSSQCVGRVWLRLVEAESGVERIRRMVDVVPDDTELSRSIGNQQWPGLYHVRATGRPRIAVANARSSITVREDNPAGEIVVECPPVHGSTIEPFCLQLEWTQGRSVSLELPYPQKGAMFQLDGRALAMDELVGLDRLYGLWLLVENPAGGERFTLDTELVGGGTSIRGLGAAEQLPPLQNGELRLNLGLWTDRVRHLLAATDDPTAIVRITVRSQSGHDLIRIRVARYDMEIHPVPSSHSVYLPAEQLEKVGEEWASRLSMEILPLWSPDERPASLLMRDDLPGHWFVPKDLAPGPWWVIGRDGDWLRFRPLLWTVPAPIDGAAESRAEPRLADVIREPARERREEQLGSLIAEMGKTPAHPDWELLQSYVALAMDFPPNTLDVLRHLVRHPETLAMAALMADDERFRPLMAFADEMPFAWGLLPVEAWQKATLRYFDHLRESLAAVESGEEICFAAFERFRERAMGARPYFKSLCDWLQEQAFPGRGMKNSGLQVVRALQTDYVTELVENEIKLLLARHDADEYWPAWQGITDLADSGLLSTEFRFSTVTGFQRPVRCGPFVAAAIALGGNQQRPPSHELVYQLRVIRGFDTEWFDSAYELGLTLGLARGEWEGVL